MHYDLQDDTSEGVLAKLAAHCRAASVQRLVLIPCGLLGLLPIHAALVPHFSNSEETEPLLDVVRLSYAPGVRNGTLEEKGRLLGTCTPLGGVCRLWCIMEPDRETRLR